MLLNQNCVYLKALLGCSAALFVLLLVLLAARGGRHRSGSLLVLRIVLAMGITIPLVCLILSLVLPLILVAVIRLTRLPWLTRPIRRLSRRVLLLVGVLLLVRLQYRSAYSCPLSYLSPSYCGREILLGPCVGIQESWRPLPLAAIGLA